MFLGPYWRWTAGEKCLMKTKHRPSKTSRGWPKEQGSTQGYWLLQGPAPSSMPSFLPAPPLWRRHPNTQREVPFFGAKLPCLSGSLVLSSDGGLAKGKSRAPLERPRPSQEVLISTGPEVLRKTAVW